MKNKIILISLLIALFTLNTILVVTDAYVSVDMTIRHFIISFSSETTDRLMHIITFFGSTKWIVLLSVVLFAMFMFYKKKAYAYSCAALIIVSTLINNGIKLIIQRPRPEYISVVEHSFSYPSGHTMASATLYGLLIYYLMKSNIVKKYKVIYGCLLGLLILLVGISRIYLGAHYFSDVFGGILLSGAIVMIFALIDEKKRLIK